MRSASFSPDGALGRDGEPVHRRALGRDDGRLVLYLQGHTAPLTGATFGPDGTEILTGSQDGTARVVACEICRPLAGLEQVAESRLARLRWSIRRLEAESRKSSRQPSRLVEKQPERVVQLLS